MLQNRVDLDVPKPYDTLWATPGARFCSGIRVSWGWPLFMAEIQLQRGMVALLDDADLPLVKGYKWYAREAFGVWYVLAPTYKPDGRRTQVYMHRLIMGAGTGQRIDHRDSNGLDNRRENLRFSTNAENTRNARKHINGATSAYKGVSWHQRSSKWKAQIGVDGKDVVLGYYPDEIKAAQAYDRAAIEYFGEFARPNFPC